MPEETSIMRAPFVRRRGHSMSRRTGQSGNVTTAVKCRKGQCDHARGQCPRYGRFWIDVSPTERRQQWVSLGVLTDSAARRELRRRIEQSGADSGERFLAVNSPRDTFGRRSDTWLRGIESGRVLRKRKRTQMKPATLMGYQSAVNWLCGKGQLAMTPLAELKNEAAREVVDRMKREGLSGKTIVSYFGVVQAVVSSVVDAEGEQLYPRKWNLEHIGLPVVNPREQQTPAFTSSEIEMLLGAQSGQARLLTIVLAATGLRIGEALGLRVEHLIDGCRILCVRQSAFDSKIQDPKTENAFRDIDIPDTLTEVLRAHVGTRTEGFLFPSACGMVQRDSNVAREYYPVMDRLGIRKPGKLFHAFRRFRLVLLEKSECPEGLAKYWAGHAKPSVTEKYRMSLYSDVQYRREWANRVGLGFEMSERIERNAGPRLVRVVAA